jgi:hypothetical protein
MRQVSFSIPVVPTITRERATAHRHAWMARFDHRTDENHLVALRSPPRRQRAFVARPGAELTTADLVAVAFPRVPADEIKNKHRLSARLAARAIGAVTVGHKRRSGGLIWSAVGSKAVANALPCPANSESDQSDSCMDKRFSYSVSSKNDVV